MRRSVIAIFACFVPVFATTAAAQGPPITAGDPFLGSDTQPQFNHRRKAVSLILLASLALSVGCKVVVLSGPVVVSVGDTVSYVLELQSDFGFAPDPPLFVLAEVPAGWQFKSSSFVGTVGNSPISGTPLLVQESPCEFQLGDLRPDYQRWHLISPVLPSGFDTSDRAQLTLEFFVGRQPSDEIELFFVRRRKATRNSAAARAANAASSRLSPGPHSPDASELDMTSELSKSSLDIKT